MSKKTAPAKPRPRRTRPVAPVAVAAPGTVTLVKNVKQPAKANAVVYQIAGLRGTVRFVKTLFVGPAPALLSVAGSGWAVPAAPKVPKAVTPAQVERARARLAAMEAAL